MLQAKQGTVIHRETLKSGEKAGKKWLRSLPCTEREMARACHYAAWGFDDAVPAISERRMEYLLRTGRSAAMENLVRLERVMAQAAASTGMSYIDLLSQTPSRLNAMVVAAQVEAGATVSRDTAKCQTDYSATLREIKMRLEKERAEEGRSDG